MRGQIDVQRISQSKLSIFGAYGGFNLGDEAILSGILKMLDELGVQRKNVTLGSLCPEVTSRQHQVPSVRSITSFGLTDEFQKTLRDSDAIIIGGGQLIMESRRIPNPWTSLLARSAMVCHEAKRLRKPVFVWGVGVERIRTIFGRFQLRRLMRADTVTVRDTRSVRILSDYDYPFAQVVGDPASVLPRGNPIRGNELMSHYSNATICAKAPRIGICITVDGRVPVKDCKTIVVVADQLIAQGGHVILFASDIRPSYDIRACNWLVSHMQHTPTVLPIKQWSTQEYSDLLSAMNVIVSTRMHPVLLATCNDVPAIPVCRSPKSLSLSECFGLPFVIESGMIGSEYLLKSIAQILSGEWPRDDIREQVIRYRRSAIVAKDLFARFLTQVD